MRLKCFLAGEGVLMQRMFETKRGTEGMRKQPARFVEHMQQLFGEEPDPVFLQESWSVGVAAATENLERRRQQQVEHEQELRNCALRELGRIASLRGRREAVSEAEELGWKSMDWARAGSASAGRTSMDWGAKDGALDDGVSAGWRTAAWVPADWVPGDQVAQRALPHGWVPHVPQAENFERKTSRRQVGGEMTMSYAEQMLGVAAGSSREEIRSAYRRMVGMCHPDRYQDASEAMRARATQAMAELNEAYRMVCESLLEQAA